MKTNIFRMLGVLTLLSGVMIACSDDETTPEVAPTFPDPVSAEVAAGDTYTFTISPSTDWTLGLSDSSVSYFSLLDGQMAAYRMYGEAGTHQITVQVSEFEEFDTDRRCEVWLTQGTGTLQETRTILTLTRRSMTRELSLYMAQYDADATDPDFVRDEDSNLLYEAEAASEMDYIYDSYNQIYLQRFAIDANLAWSFTELPAWFGTNEVRGGEVGRTEIFSRVNSTAHPFEDTTFDLGFIDVSNANAPKVLDTKVRVSLPGCDAFCAVDRLAATVAFTAAGEYDNNGALVETGAVGTFNAPMGARLLVAAKVGDRYLFDADRVDWVTLTMEELPEASTEYGIWSRSFTVTVAANSEAARSAVVIAVPQSIARTISDPSELLTEEGTALIEGATLVSTLNQASGLPEDFEAIQAVDPATLKGWNITFGELAKGSWPWMNDWASIPYAYTLNYTSTEAVGEFFVQVDYASYRIFGFDGPDEEYTDLESCWIALEEGAQTGSKRVTMRLGEQYTAADGSTKTYENPLAGDGGENEATIVFYDRDGVALTMLYCSLTKGSTPGGGEVDENAVSFVDAEAAAAAGVYLKPMVQTDADYSHELAYMEVPQYYVIFTKPASVALNVPSYIYGHSYNTSWMNVEQSSETVATLVATETSAGTKSAVTLYASMGLEGATSAAQLTCLYDPSYVDEGAGDDEEPTTPPYDPHGAITFVDMAAAEALGATLYALPETDDMYSFDLEYVAVPQFRLTLKQPGSITLRVPAYYFGFQYSSGWLSFSPDWMENTTEVTITMTSTGTTEQQTSLSLYVDMETQAAQIHCVLLNE